MKRLLLAIVINMFLFTTNFACAMVVEEGPSSQNPKTVSRASTWKFLKEGDVVEINCSVWSSSNTWAYRSYQVSYS